MDAGSIPAASTKKNFGHGELKSRYARFFIIPLLFP